MLVFIGENDMMFASKPNKSFRVFKLGNSANKLVELVERSFSERGRLLFGLDTNMQAALSKERALCFLPTLDSLRKSISQGLANMHEVRREYITKRLKDKSWTLGIHQKNNWRCWFCGKRVARTKKRHAPNKAVTDHLNPVFRNGTNDDSNLVTACNKCNGRKSFKTLEEYRLFVSLQAHQDGALLKARYVFHTLIKLLPSPYKEKVQALLNEIESDVPKVQFYGEASR
jgi:hypothetical protein